MAIEFLGVIDRTGEGAKSPVPFGWDTRWTISDQTGFGWTAWGDWALADPDNEVFNVGGLAATDQLSTAILIQFGTHKRRAEGAAGEPGDIRGWFGDTFDVDASKGEGPIGSWLWTLSRMAITDDTIALAEFFARECLQTLVRQGVATRVDALAEPDRLRGLLAIHVAVHQTGRDYPFQMTVPLAPTWT